MSKIAYVFPGQGSQAVGMGKELFDNFAVFRQTLEEADDALGFKLSKMCFEGPVAELNSTVNTQPAILAVSVGAYRVLQQECGVTPGLMAGHSLGEYSALVAAGALQFADAVRVVRQRGSFMQEAAPAGSGGMAAILGLPREKVISCCQEASAQGLIEPVNFNCPGQVVIAGEKAALQKAMELCRQAGAKRAVELAVSGPFHSSLMKPAGERLAQVLDEITINNPSVPVVANVSAANIQTAVEIKDSLVRQISGAVLWEDSVARMADQGITTMVEIGPGKVLCGLIKKINKEITAVNVEDVASLEKVLALFKEVG